MTQVHEVDPQGQLKEDIISARRRILRIGPKIAEECLRGAFSGSVDEHPDFVEAERILSELEQKLPNFQPMGTYAD